VNPLLGAPDRPLIFAPLALVRDPLFVHPLARHRPHLSCTPLTAHPGW
jgi:hypothetical protein